MISWAKSFFISKNEPSSTSSLMRREHVEGLVLVGGDDLVDALAASAAGGFGSARRRRLGEAARASSAR